MRHSTLLLFAFSVIVGCSESVSPLPPADSGASDAPADIASLDAPMPDVADVTPTDVPAADATDVVDVPHDHPPTDVTSIDAACPMAGQTRCGGACVDTNSDVRHCGGCSNECCTGQVCAAGRCAFACSAGSTVCTAPGERCGACVNVQSDPNNCGACGRICPAGLPCVNGSCGACGSCMAGSVCCGSTCVNTQNDPAHCGACGRACPTGVPCVAGTCFECLPGHRVCAGSCVNPNTDPANCGGCGRQCCAGNACAAGTCVPGCTAGRTACPGPMSSCLGGVCVDAANDPMNCGGCGRQCAAGETCVTGSCRGGAFMALDPCRAPGDYMMASTVRFGGTVGSAYEPRCVTVRAGSAVTWEGGFGGHPLVPSTRGSAMNPITRVASGTRAEVRFPRAGFYPYYCEFHGTNAGVGMAGVVQVTE